MEVAHEGVTAPIGFQAAGVNCGIKKLRKDVALVVSATPAVTAATVSYTHLTLPTSDLV